ncbi:hypothetical protein CRG98_047624, partial [Punica granatum]
MRIWRTLRPVDHAFIRGIIGDVVMFTETPVDWLFLRTAAEFWDPEHAVFHFQGTELAPTIEEYTALIQRPTPTTHSIFVPNPFTTVQAHTSSFSDLIEAGKKLDLGIKLGRMEDPTSKGDELSKKAPTTSSSSCGRRGKEVTVNTVNTAQQVPQQYSMNYTAAPPTAPSYTPQAPQYRPQASTQPIYYPALPPPPPSAVPSPVVHHYAPTPSQAPQYQPPAPRASQPTQRVPPPQ